MELVVHDERLYLIGPGAERQYVVRAPDPVLCELVGRLRGDVTTDRGMVDDTDLAALLAALGDAGLAERIGDEEPVPEAERYEGQLRYFADVRDGSEPRGILHRRVTAAHVVVLGVGGLGTWTALALACTGLGRITLVDGDRVEIGNLNRQMLFTPQDVGQPKAAVAAQRLRAFAPACEVTPVEATVRGPDDVARLTADADLLVDAADSPPGRIEHWVEDGCTRTKTAFLMMSQHPPKLRIGPLIVPGRTPSLRDWEHGLGIDDALLAAAREQLAARPPASATFGPACAVIGGIAATEVVHHLSGARRPAAFATAITLDTRTWQTAVAPGQHVVP